MSRALYFDDLNLKVSSLLRTYNGVQKFMLTDSEGNVSGSENVIGAGKEIIMKPQHKLAANQANLWECITDATGFIQIVFDIGGIAIANAASVVAKWSTTYNDQSAVRTALELITDQTTGKFAVPDGSYGTNQRSFPLVPGKQCVITVARSAPIRTLMVELTAPVGGVLLIGMGVQAV